MSSPHRLNPLDFARRFQARFGVSPKIFAAPGRVNLIGEHTDYNDGFVLPSAIEFKAHVAISPRADRKLVLQSEEFPQQFDLDLDQLPKGRLGAWCDYVLGVAWMLWQNGSAMRGADVLVRGEVPVGSGLS